MNTYNKERTQTHLLDELPALFPRLPLHPHIPPERRILRLRRRVLLPPLDLGEPARCKRHALPVLLRPLRAFLHALDEHLREPRFLGLRALALCALRALDRLAKEQDDRHDHLWEADASMHGRAHEVLGEEKCGLLRKPFVVHTRFEVLLRRADVRVEVERAERARLGLGRRGECRGEDGENIRRERDVGVRVPREVQEGADDVQVEGKGACVVDESRRTVSTRIRSVENVESTWQLQVRPGQGGR